MLLLGVIDLSQHPTLEAIVDSLLLASFSAPLIYFLVIKPFVIARDKTVQSFETLAMTDQLTGISNRRSFNVQIESFIESVKRREIYGAFLIIDLDKFKLINDTYGHDRGDQVLIEAAQRLKTRLRKEDLLGRMGGDEFIILMKYIDADENIANKIVLKKAKQIIETIEKPMILKNMTHNIGVSVGYQIFGSEVISFEDVFKKADKKMYEMKNSKSQK